MSLPAPESCRKSGERWSRPIKPLRYRGVCAACRSTVRAEVGRVHGRAAKSTVEDAKSWLTTSPVPIASFQASQSNFVTYVNANLAALGFTPPDMAPTTAAQTGWATTFPAHVAVAHAAKAAKQTKDAAR